MGNYRRSRTASTSRNITFGRLKDQMYSLNMRMLLAMQHHDENAQEELKKQMAEVQEEIDRMSLGGGHHHTNASY